MLDDYMPFIMVGTWLLLLIFFISLGRRRMWREVAYRRALFEGKGEWRRVSLGEFPAIDEEFYSASQMVLQENAFKLAGAVEEAKAAAVFPKAHTPQQVMLSPDGTAVAMVWWEGYGFWERLYYRLNRKSLYAGCFRIYSEAEDGRFFLILALPRWRRLEEPEQVKVRYIGQKGGVGAGWVVFRGDFEGFRQSDPTYRPRVFNSLDEVLAAEERLRALRVAYRTTAGLLTQGELADRGMDPAGAERYLRAFNKYYANKGENP